jgi:hypothetical protein
MLKRYRITLDMLVSETHTTLEGVEDIRERLMHREDSALSELRMST